MKYPNGIKKEHKPSPITYRNRGMSLESDLNESNEYYREIDKAYIYKKPTPVKIVKVNYPSRDKAVIKEAYYTIPSTTDYNGLYKGKYIDFEAKETKNKTAFPLANIHSHQIKHIKNIYNHQGIVFIIVRFTHTNETFLLPGETFLNYLAQEKRKSIPYSFFQKNAYLIKDGYKPRIDYLSVVDKLMEV